MKNYTKISAIIVLGALVILFFTWQKAPGLADAPQNLIDAIYAGIEFDMPQVQEPEFLPNQCTITDFGAVGNGLENNADAFLQAIEAMTAKGGGKVIVPRGVWMTGPIELQSNINLHLEVGALIIFSRDFDEYPIVKTSFEGLETYRCQSPISGRGLENVAITGNGVIDGSGDAWRPVKKEKMTDRQWSQLVQSGGVLSDDGKIWYPTELSKKGDRRDNFNVPDFDDPSGYEAVKDFLRPVMVSLINCQKVLLDGPTFQNSPAWNIHPLMCEDVIVRNITVRNPWYSQNGDGLDLESCKNVLIYNNNFDVGDDAICFKSGKNEDGRKRAMPTENVIVTNNIVYHGHGGFTVGSEMSGSVRNVHISNCTFIGTDIGLRFKSTRGRGGIVENIYISNIDMVGIPAEAIGFNLFYEGKSPILESAGGSSLSTELENLPAPVDETTPAFRNIHMKNITVTSSGTAAFFQGLPEMKLQNITLENAVLEAEKGITFIDADGITFKNVKLIHKKETGLVLYNSADIELNKFTIENDANLPLVRLLGKETKSIRIIDSTVKSKEVYIAEEVPADALVIEPEL